MAHIQHPNLVQFIGAVVDKHDDRKDISILQPQICVHRPQMAMVTLKIAWFDLE